MFEYLGELVVVKHPVLDGRLPVHLVYLVVSEPVPDGGQQLPQSVLVDEANVVLVETSKGILDDVLWVSSLERSGAVIISGQTSTVSNLQPLAEHGEEHGEVDGARCLVHHVFQVLV